MNFKKNNGYVFRISMSHAKLRTYLTLKVIHCLSERLHVMKPSALFLLSLATLGFGCTEFEVSMGHGEQMET